MRKVPELRFDGFDGEWEEKKISKIAKINPKSSPLPEKFKYVDLTSVSGTSLINFDIINKKEAPSRAQRVAKKGDIFYQTVRPYQKNNFFFDLDDTDFIFSTGYAQIRTTNNNSRYIFTLIQTKRFVDTVMNRTTGTSFPAISTSELSDINVKISRNISEQEKIGDLFKKIDALIVIQETKISKMEDFKKSMLQKMFPKKGELVPEFRFDGFDGEWNMKALGDLSEISTGKLDANAMVLGGEYDFYTSGIEKYKIDNYAFEGPSITVAGNGATVGYMHLADGKFNAYQRTYVIQKIKGDRIFIFYQIQSKLPRKIHEESRQGNIPYIVMNMLTDLYLDVPEIQEQAKIGQFFKNLDSQIENEEKLLESYKMMKKSLLQKMFV